MSSEMQVQSGAISLQKFSCIFGEVKFKTVAGSVAASQALLPEVVRPRHVPRKQEPYYNKALVMLLET